MDDLVSKFDELVVQAYSAESRIKEEYQKCLTKIDDYISQSINNGTPLQNKKRPKRLESIDGEEKNGDREPSMHNSISRTSHRKNSVDESRIVKNTTINNISVAENHTATGRTSGRPARQARLKACQNLKEPDSKGKLRNEGITIKKERISLAKSKMPAEEPMELDSENDQNALNGIVPIQSDKEAEKRKSNDEGFGSTNEKENEPIPSREMSIVVVPQPILKVEILSDDEDAEKMPPPSMPPPAAVPQKKRIGRPKKSSSKNASQIVIKKEKDADETSAVSSAESSLSSSSMSEPTHKKKEPKTSSGVGKVRIKTEKLSGDANEKQSKSKDTQKPSVTSPAQSEKSVYEDALDGDAIMRPAFVAVDKLMAMGAEKNKTYAMDKNGTFTASPANGTFVLPNPANGTFSVKSPENLGNATFDIRPLPGPQNSTFVMDNKTPSENGGLINASIMTEDNSLVEASPDKPYDPPSKKPVVAKKPTAKATATKKKNELFSLQSPIKSRIEAFEKAAVASPIQHRLASSKNTTPSQPARLHSKTSTTPLASQRFVGLSKVNGQTTPTAQTTYTLTKGISTSASKLAHLQKKPTLASASIPKSHSLSREPSLERLPTLSAASSSSSLAMDEKKKKREEKQRLAQQQREQLEKEKREHAERLLREKEEKHKKLVQEKEEKLRAEQVKKAKKMEEFEKRRYLEELNQRMQAEQKREELAKLEQQQRFEREQSDLFKLNQAKENHEIKLYKQLHQQKMQQQQKQQHAQQQLQMKKAKQAAADKANGEQFNFDMIQTDDSTDDESTSTSSKKTKRPPPPQWCSKEERRLPIRIQGEIKLDVIDQFFSVAPMTPDLREIFPTIDARKLKRNSSAVWRTPPRYSQMPKY